MHPELLHLSSSEVSCSFDEESFPRRQADAPVEPEASFDKRDDWAHVFSMDEGVGYKLMSAIYDAKVSFLPAC